MITFSENIYKYKLFLNHFKCKQEETEKKSKQGRDNKRYLMVSGFIPMLEFLLLSD